MKLADIYQFFQNPPPTYLSQELAVCYVLSVLLRGESYGTELIQQLESDYPRYRLSDPILFNVLQFLKSEKAIVGHWQKVLGRGRPRRMYRLHPLWHAKATSLARLWQEYMQSNHALSRSTQATQHVSFSPPPAAERGACK